MNKQGRFIRSVPVLLCLALFPTSTWADEQKDWEFNLAPFYLWAISIDGDMGIRGRASSASVDFGDIWDSLEGVFTVRFNGLYKDKFGFIFDYNYLDLGQDVVSDRANVEVGLKSQIVNFAGTYRFIGGDHSLDGVAGIRYTILDAEIKLRNIGADLDGDQDWVDPIVGLAYNYQISDMWSLRLYGDIGGFGVSSDFTWQALGLLIFSRGNMLQLLPGIAASELIIKREVVMMNLPMIPRFTVR